MTTQITIKTVEWPVELKIKDESGSGRYTVERELIHPFTERTLHIHSSRSVKITELPKFALDQGQTSSPSSPE
jgi:hypothetical protein